MKKISIIPVIRKGSDRVYVEQSVKILCDHGATVYCENRYAGQFSAQILYADTEIVYRDSDLILVFGGDGSMLHAAEYATRYDVPLLGVNLGRLGYIADLEKEEVYLLRELFDGKYTVGERMMLRVSICTESGEKVLCNALNDVVISRGAYARSIDLLLCADGRNVRTIRSDGLILATPTGSTAYSMAAGGSVLDPTLSCICATPICPISQYARPVIFSGDSKVEVRHEDDRSGEWCITVDGEATEPLRMGQRLLVQQSEQKIRMLSLKKEGFFEKLNDKISKYELK